MDYDLTQEMHGSRLEGKVALVVGGGSTGDYPGTGSATARLFAAQGARVAVMGRTEGHTLVTVEEIRAAGGDAVPVIGDTKQRPDCARVVDETVKTWGQLDVLVNNVAVHRSVDVERFDEDAWDDIFDGNLKASMRMTSAALPQLRARGRGSVINIGSVAGVRTSGSVGYGTAKGALEPLTRDLAMALGRFGVRVNCVIPGHLHTPHVARVSGGNEMRDLRNQLNMLGREGTGWDAAWAVLFLASEEAAFVTGQSLVVDGGMSAILAFSQILRTDRAVREGSGS
jgi:NAD(P)-dependent dehydrogenase (short-subunit alcohol dehydrogenase family)